MIKNTLKTVKNYFQFTNSENKPNQKLDSYWIQNLELEIINDRESVFRPYIENKDVLHIGCTDYPIFDENNNLHLKFSKIAKVLHGMDVDNEGLSVLNSIFNGTYYNNINDAYSNTYDTVIAPETIEHVENVGDFLKSLTLVNSKHFIITGPNAFNNQSISNAHYDKKTKKYTEAIHPDHNCWYSPYTLKNVIEKYTDLSVKKIYLCMGELMIICICEKR